VQRHRIPAKGEWLSRQFSRLTELDLRGFRSGCSTSADANQTIRKAPKNRGSSHYGYWGTSIASACERIARYSRWSSRPALYLRRWIWVRSFQSYQQRKRRYDTICVRCTKLQVLKNRALQFAGRSEYQQYLLAQERRGDWSEANTWIYRRYWQQESCGNPIRRSWRELQDLPPLKMQARSAFSLVEVALALGVAALSMLVIFSLLPIGLQTNQRSLEQTTSADILSAVVADLRATPVTNPRGNATTSTSLEFVFPQRATRARQLFFSTVQDNSRVCSNPTHDIA